MKQYICSIKEILWFKGSPQSLPTSIFLMLGVILTSLLLNGLLGSMVYSMDANIFRSLFEVAILLLFIQFSLQFFNHKERIIQTAIALFSVQIVLNLIALPIIANLSTDVIQESKSLNALLGLFLMLLLMYSVMVMSHILKYAFSTALQKAVVISISYHFASILLVSMMFPSPAM